VHIRTWGVQIVSVKVSNALQHINHEIASQIIFLNFVEASLTFLNFKAARRRILCTNNTDETHAVVHHINDYISWSPSYGSIKQLRKNENLQKASDIWRDRMKKLDENAQHCKKRFRLFLNRASKVDMMAILVWVNTCISGYVMYNLVGIIVCNM